MNHLINLADLPVFIDTGFFDEISVSKEDYAQLVEAINNPPKATEALVRAIKRVDAVLKEGE